MYVQVDTLFMIWPTTCWKNCIFNIDDMDARRNRTLSHMRTNETWISKRNRTLYCLYIHLPYIRKQVCMQTEEALIRLHKCLSLQLAYVDSYNVRLLLQWPRQFELLKWRSAKARGACQSCQFYTSHWTCWSLICPINIISIISGNWQWLWRYSVQRIQTNALLYLQEIYQLHSSMIFNI